MYACILSMKYVVLTFPSMPLQCTTILFNVLVSDTLEVMMIFYIGKNIVTMLQLRALLLQLQNGNVMLINNKKEFLNEFFGHGF